MKYGEVVALDFASEALVCCRKRGLALLVQGSAEDLPLADGRCDVVTALGLIEHVDHDRQFLQEIRRVLKPGGHGLLLTSAYQFLWGQHDEAVHPKRRYLKRPLERLIQDAGLEVVKASHVNTILFLPILLLRWLERLRLRPVKAGQGSPDLFQLPAVLNNMLYLLLRLRRRTLRPGTTLARGHRQHGGNREGVFLGDCLDELGDGPFGQPQPGGQIVRLNIFVKSLKH